MGRLDDRDLYSGLIRLHVLHHASKEAVFGLGMLEELGRHGYQISAGTLYPIFHSLQQKGYHSSSEMQDGKSLRKLYRATPFGPESARRCKRQNPRAFS
jgi:DNA-binding PadR family transcriptional regulator